MERVSNENLRFGEYLVEFCIAETTHTRTWQATQLSVGRSVWIEELTTHSESDRADFLANVRAKAAVENPIVGSIYEASAHSEVEYYAYELLPGSTLAELSAQRATISPELMAQILSKIAEVSIHYDYHLIASSPLGLEHIFIDENRVIRLKNLAIAEQRLASHSHGDMVRLGCSLEALLDQQDTGAASCKNLLSRMRGAYRESQLSWQEVYDHSLQIYHQLTTPAEFTINTGPPQQIDTKKLIMVATVVVGFVMIASLLFLKKTPLKVGNHPHQQQWISIPRGDYKTPDQLQITLPEFSISASEVTIGEYAEFLETLTILKAQNAEKTFDHSEQPDKKNSHIPDDWGVLLQAAKKSKIWREHIVNLSTPVVGIDWWDAYAYAKWKKVNLPTQEQWHAALITGTLAPLEIKISNLIPVNEKNADRTEHGILGMAGSVSEWTSEPRPTPANPLGKKFWVIMGGSYMKPDQGALSRQWVSDRMFRSPDLGFRICRKN